MGQPYDDTPREDPTEGRRAACATVTERGSMRTEARTISRRRLCLPIDEAVMMDERATNRRRRVGLAAALATLVACAIWSAAGAAHGEARLQVAVDDALKSAPAAPAAGPRGLVGGAAHPGRPCPCGVERVDFGLARFPLTEVWAEATPERGAPGRYRVRFYGRLRGADTAPVLCERLLQFGRREGRLTLVADRTEERLRAAYYLAFQDPVVRSRSHLVVIAERNWEWLIPRTLACNEQTLRVARRFGLDSTSPQLRQKTIVYVSASRRQAWDAAASRPHEGMSAGAVDRADLHHRKVAGVLEALHGEHDAARARPHLHRRLRRRQAPRQARARGRPWPPRAIGTSPRCARRSRAATTRCPCRWASTATATSGTA